MLLLASLLDSLPVTLGMRSEAGAWNPDAVVNRLQLVLALGGMALLGWHLWLSHKGQPARFRRTRDVALAVLGLLGAWAYPNFGRAHFTNFIHAWDVYHYYVGAKYFPELGYEWLYDCTAVADYDAGLTKQTLARHHTDLRTNVVVPSSIAVENADVCRSRFSPGRWQQFVSDVTFFRNRSGYAKWVWVQKDHGYNASPVWTLAGHALADSGPATPLSVTLLCWVDPLLLLLAAAALGWAFGWRTAAVAALVFGVNIPSRYTWTGGAFLRHDWFFALALSVALLKKSRPALAGAAVAYATLLRLFPGLLLAGPFLLLLARRRSTGAWDRELLRFGLGGVVATVLLVGASLALPGGVDNWVTFARNTQKHAATPLTNHMGLRTVVSYRPSTIGAALADGKQADPWAAWKQARLDGFAAARPVFHALLLLALWLLYRAVAPDGTEAWLAAALGTGFICFGAELTSYYYCFLSVFAVAVAKRREVALLLLLACVAWCVIDWAPFGWMSTWEDEKKVAMSVVALLVVALGWFGFTRAGGKWALLPEPAGGGLG
jgi:hypothetical protein